MLMGTIMYQQRIAPESRRSLERVVFTICLRMPAESVLSVFLEVRMIMHCSKASKIPKGVAYSKTVLVLA